MIGSVLAIKPFLFVDYNTREVKGGVAMDTLDTVAKYYGFTYYVWLSPDVFILHKNGSIGGSFGDVKSFYLYNFHFLTLISLLFFTKVINGHVDFSLEQSTPMELIYGHFTTALYSIFSTYIEMKPERLPLYKNVAICLDGYTWTLTGLSVLSVWIVLYFIFTLENVIEYNVSPFSWY